MVVALAELLLPFGSASCALTVAVLRIVPFAVGFTTMVIVAFPLWITFVASTLRYDEIITVPMPLLPGDQLIENYVQVLTAGSQKGSAAPVSSSSTVTER